MSLLDALNYIDRNVPRVKREWPYRDLYRAAKHYVEVRREMVKLLAFFQKWAEDHPGGDNRVMGSYTRDAREKQLFLERLLKKMPAYGSHK